MRLRFATTSGVGGATGAGAAGGSEDDDVLTVLSVDEGDDDIKGLHTLRRQNNFMLPSLPNRPREIGC